MAGIHVPDVPRPTSPLCWRQDPATLARCDRWAGHGGACSWQMAAELAALKDMVKEWQAKSDRLDVERHILMRDTELVELELTKVLRALKLCEAELVTMKARTCSAESAC